MSPNLPGPRPEPTGSGAADSSDAAVESGATADLGTAAALGLGAGNSDPDPRDDADLAELENKLRSSLHSGADPIVVDVTALRIGAHTGARRLRAQRRASVLLAAAVFVAIPLGVGAGLASQRSTPVAAPEPESQLFAEVTTSPTPTLTLTMTPEVTVTSATPTPTLSSSSPSPSATTSSPAPTRTRPSTRTTRHTDGSGGDGSWDGGDFGDALALGDGGTPLGFEVTDTLDLGPSAGMDPPVVGQMCNIPERASRPGPIVSRQWGWSGHRYSVYQVITGYERGTGLARFADISEDDGQCRWLDPQRVVRSNSREWFAVEKRGKYFFARGAVLRGDVILSLEVTHPEGTSAALGMLDRLMDDLIERWERYTD